MPMASIRGKVGRYIKVVGKKVNDKWSSYKIPVLKFF